MRDSKIDTKFYVNFEYLRIMEDKLIDIFSTPSIIKKTKNKDYVNNKSKKKLQNEDPHHTETVS